MLKLNYIIADTLPEHELQYLQENLRGDKVHNTSDRAQFILLSEEKISQSAADFLTKYPAEECLFISGKKKNLQKAAVLGMATLGYLSSENSTCAEGVEKMEAYLQEQQETNSKTESGKRFQEKNEEYEYEEQNFSADMYAEGMEEIDYTFLNHVYERHHNIPWTILQTERCIIREFSMDYLDELFEMYAGVGMTDYMEPLFDYEEEKEYQQAYIEHMYRFYGYGMWIICDKQTNRLIGRAGIEHREELNGEPELGYAIAVPYQHQGYATEVCQAILRYAAEELQFPQITCLIDPENKVSIHFAQKLGFSFVETLNLDGKMMKKYILKI